MNLVKKELEIVKNYVWTARYIALILTLILILLLKEFGWLG